MSPCWKRNSIHANVQYVAKKGLINDVCDTFSSSTAEAFFGKNNILNWYVKVFIALLEDNDKNMSELEERNKNVEMCSPLSFRKKTLVHLC